MPSLKQMRLKFGITDAGAQVHSDIPMGQPIGFPPCHPQGLITLAVPGALHGFLANTAPSSIPGYVRMTP